MLKSRVVEPLCYGRDIDSWIYAFSARKYLEKFNHGENAYRYVYRMLTRLQFLLHVHYSTSKEYADKKENLIFLIYKEIQKGSVAK